MKIYKFYKFTNYNLNAVKDSKIWMSSPINFNDPFDARLRIACDKDTEIRKLLSDFMREKYRDDEPAVIDQIANYYLYDMIDEPFSHYFYEAIGSKQEDLENLISFIKERSGDMPLLSTFYTTLACVGICSFSTDIHSPIMWAHYADNHKGFCIEYELEDLPKPIKASQVYYEPELPPTIYNSHDSALGSDGIVRQLCSKAKEWGYEDEFRIVSPIHRDKLIDFPGKIKAVYYGINASNEDVKLLKALLKDKNEIYHNTAMFASELRKFNFSGTRQNSKEAFDISMNFANESIKK